MDDTPYYIETSDHWDRTPEWAEGRQFLLEWRPMEKASEGDGLPPMIVGHWRGMEIIELDHPLPDLMAAVREIARGG